MSHRFSGRSKLGTVYPQTLLKEGQYHTVGSGDDTISKVLCCGLACSECISGQNLAEVIKPGYDYERITLECLAVGSPAPPLAVHTSAGIPPALIDFIHEIGKNLPWPDDVDDWCVSLQMEGASAVLAAIDLMTQLRQSLADRSGRLLDEWHIGVAASSYHGPPSSSPGSRNPLFIKRHNQILYPVLTPFMSPEERAAYVGNFSNWLEDNYSHMACILVEPQWGSSAGAYYWDKDILRSIIELAHSKGVLVIADEIMCGLGRHGQGTLFLSQAWELDVDAVTFGKAIAAGVYPLSGVIVKEGAAVLGASKRTVMQSHTYSGGNVRSLMTATEVLRKLPSLFPTMTSNSSILQQIMTCFESRSRGLFVTHGLGLMWGALANRNHPTYLCSVSEVRVEKFMTMFQACCKTANVLPYFVPCGGFMVTPLYDVTNEVIEDIGSRLNGALAQALDDFCAHFQLTLHDLRI